MVSIFVALQIVLMAMGCYCAHRLDSSNPWYVRLLVLAPALAAAFSLIELLIENDIIYFASIARSVGMILIYVMVLFALAGKPLLQIRSKR